MIRAPSGAISGSGICEGSRISGVEALCERTRQFEMLPLVLADWNAISLVQKYVGSLQHRIGEQSGGGFRFTTTS